MPLMKNDLLTSVKQGDLDGVLLVIDEYRRNGMFSERPPFEEALCNAVNLGHTEIIQVFLRLKVNVAWADADGRRPIHHASRLGSVTLIKRILGAGSPLNVVDRCGRSALYSAVCAGSVASVQLLLSEGAHVDRARTYAHGETPLHAAARTGQLEIARMLIARGADVSLRTHAGLLPLHLAVRGRYHSLVALLCECGVDVGASGSGGVTAAHTAAETASVDTLHLLLECVGAGGCGMANARDLSGRTPLHCVAASRPATPAHASVAELLAKSGADLDAMDADGRTPLHCAAMSGNTEVLVVLVASGAQLDLTESGGNGDTALGLAVLHEQHEMARMLLSARADARVPDAGGMTPLHKIQGARGEEKLAITKLLLRHGARVNAVSVRGYTPLDRCVFHMVIGSPNHGVLQRLVRAGAQLRRMKDVASMRSVNNSPLCWLTFRGDLRLAELLVHSGWDLNSERWLHLPGSTAAIEAFLEWLRSVARQPRPLMPICRSTIREVLSECGDDRDVMPGVDALPLPALLKGFLHLNDILTDD